jgi:hypothetical protein
MITKSPLKQAADSLSKEVDSRLKIISDIKTPESGRREKKSLGKIEKRY